MKEGICEKACAILHNTHDGNDLHKWDLWAVQEAANDHLNEKGYAQFDKLHQAVSSGQYKAQNPLFA